MQRNGVTLIECINNYFKSEHITGMKCENCTKNNEIPPASKGFTKKQAIAKLPDCLCIQIQRNSWSDQSYEMIKKMSFVQFPSTIKIDNPAVNLSSNLDSADSTKSNNLANFLNQYSNNSFSLKQVGIGGLLGGNSKKETNRSIKTAATCPSSNPLNVQQYVLQSAVVHYGSAHSGHFVSYRRPLANTKTQLDRLNPQSTTEDWLQISDSDIRRCKQYHLFSSNVYMLFYDKVNSLVV